MANPDTAVNRNGWSKIDKIAPARIRSRPASAAVSQQHDFVHAGALASIADSAAGYAALTLMPPGAGVLTAEYKINFLAQAKGDEIIARAKVERAGKSLVIVGSSVYARRGAEETKCAVALVSLTPVPFG